MDFPSPFTPAETRGIRKWFVVALVVSLLFHAWLLQAARLKKLEGFDAGTQTERLIPRAFTMKQVKIDPKVFDNGKPEPTPAPKPQEVVKVQIPADRISADKLPNEVRLKPNAANELVNPILAEKPRVDVTAMAKTTAQESAVPRDLDNALRKQLESDTAPKIPTGAKPILPSSSNDGMGAATGDPAGNGAKFSNLDDLLNKTGPLTGKVAPVNMPGGALFEYDSASLRADSIAILGKVAQLIEKNPKATFSIEGHTDNFGKPEYNQKLSEARAKAVKDWLIANMKLDASRIQTHGFGSTRLIVPKGTPEEQQMNRRVEIVIRTPKS